MWQMSFCSNFVALFHLIIEYSGYTFWKAEMFWEPDQKLIVPFVSLDLKAYKNKYVIAS